MLSVFRAVLERVKALFITQAALDFEAQLLSQDAERRAELLRQADRYEQEGLHGIADMVRKNAEGLSSQRPLQAVLPAVVHLEAKEQPTNGLLALTDGHDRKPAQNGSGTSKRLPAKKRRGKP